MPRRLQRDGPGDSGVRLSPSEDSLFKWTAELDGPPDTPFAGATFRLAIQVPNAYPMAPPAVRFCTPCFHPNVHWRSGEICLDILKTAWSPAWGLQSTMTAVVALLGDPAGGADSPLNCDAGNLLRAGDEVGFASLARLFAVEHAGAPSD